MPLLKVHRTVHLPLRLYPRLFPDVNVALLLQYLCESLSGDVSFQCVPSLVRYNSIPVQFKIQAFPHGISSDFST